MVSLQMELLYTRKTRHDPQHRKKTSAENHQVRAIKYHLTPSGLLFATLSPDTPSFEDYFAGLEELTNTVDFTKLPHRRSISYEGRFNWKTMCVLLIHNLTLN
jgi:hypothetical protein